MLELVDVTKVYQQGRRTVEAVRGVSLRIAAGEFVAIMGPSGSGKSTLLHLFGALDTPTTGRALFQGQDLQSMTDRQRSLLRRERIGFVFQSFNLIPTLSAAENITLPMALAGTKPDREWVDAVIETVGLQNRLQHRPSELSGGQQQRVAVARALASRPAIIFADEPTGNLDSRSSADILGFLERATRELGQTIVMVTHDPIAASYAGTAVFLADGRVHGSLAHPTAEDVLDHIKRLGG